MAGRDSLRGRRQSGGSVGSSERGKDGLMKGALKENKKRKKKELEVQA